MRELAKKGVNVILAARSVSKGEAAKKDICAAIAPAKCDVHVVQLDLASMASVLAFADEFKSTNSGGSPQT